jgi:DNA (cytosine-5)-methyltransferase 1
LPKRRILSLFSGIGGMDLGFESTGGYETVGFCELEPSCHPILNRHWPTVPIHNDIRTLTRDVAARMFDGRPDLIIGGFPCKQTSCAAAIQGRRAGLDGADSGLWSEYLRLVGELNPYAVVIENPPGALRWEAEIKSSLEGLGYAVSRFEGSSWDVGAPHLRKRVFWVADRNRKRLEVARGLFASAIEAPEGRASYRDFGLQTLAGVLRVDDGVSDRFYGAIRKRRITQLGNSCDPRLARVA